MPDFASFRTRLQDRIKPAFHYNVDAHAESLTYTPDGGSPVTITAHCEFEKTLDFENHTEDSLEELRVRVRKSEIAQPNLGDQVLRTVANDASQDPYTFTGDIDDETRDEWRLTFTRKRRNAQGFK